VTQSIDTADQYMHGHARSDASDGAAFAACLVVEIQRESSALFKQAKNSE
jgi:hypothetical protein